jgi:hypothetical protein
LRHCYAFEGRRPEDEQEDAVGVFRGGAGPAGLLDVGSYGAQIGGCEGDEFAVPDGGVDGLVDAGPVGRQRFGSEPGLLVLDPHICVAFDGCAVGDAGVGCAVPRYFALFADERFAGLRFGGGADGEAATVDKERADPTAV